MASPIPIQNLYYLFCYAWDRRVEGALADVDQVDSPELVDLLAKVLIDGTNRLMRRGLERGYVTQLEDLPTVRGKIQIRESVSLLAQRKQRLVCAFDEFETNILSNQILVSTLRRLCRFSALDTGLRHQLGGISRQLRAVDTVRISADIFRRVRIHRNNAIYDFLMRICELIFHSTLPDDSRDGFRFKDILRDERQMAWVFEGFVRNFLRLEQGIFRVSKKQIKWDATGDADQLAMLPRMETDIHLERDGERVIIDTKYYAEMFQTHHETKKIRSGNLYQMVAYLKNSEAMHADYADAKGILLYPSAGDDVRLKAHILNHNVEVSTLNLAQPWPAIHEELLAIALGGPIQEWQI
jgi:5-methylcytosine-specific restriction enzyme subunit McrC